MFKNKDNLIILVGFIIGIIISVVGAHADTQYEASDIYYDNSNSSLMNVDVQGAVDELADKYNSVRPTKCLDGYACFDEKKLALGDYVSMTPTKSSYTTDTSKTGYTETQTINPQELNLWRVISINPDGTVDMVSEYISSTEIYFQGLTGYVNLVGYLNVLASQYENSKYTKGSRHFGYNGQTEYITDTSKFATTAPWKCSTGESCNPTESQGGGDELYTKDYNLAKEVLGTSGASKIDETMKAPVYWLASRRYVYSTTFYSWWGLVALKNDSFDGIGLYGYNSEFLSRNGHGSIRPIVTLKSGLKYTGSGTKDDPVVIVS